MGQFSRITRALAKSLGYSPDELMSAFAPAVESDYEAIIAFRRKHLGDHESWNDETYIRWRYAFSDGESTANSRNRVWLVKLDDRILGMIGVQHAELVIGDRRLAAIHPMDLLVDASVAGGGLGAWVTLALNQKYDIVLVIGANKNSATIVQRIFHPMPSRQVWKMALNAQWLLDRFVLGRFAVPSRFAALGRFVKARSLSCLIGALLNPLLRAVSNIKLAAYRRNGLRAEFLDRFPDAVENLSESQKGQFFYRYRDAGFLNWKFAENPNVAYQRLGFYRDGELVGYVVYRLSGSGSASKADVEDFFWLEDDGGESGLPEAMFAELIGRLRDSRVGLVKVSSYGARATTAMERLGFVFREENLLFSLSCNVAELESVIYNADNWFLTEADAHGAAS